MTLARNTVIPDSDQTKYILLNSVGDMEFLPRPADNSRWHLTDIIITVDTPGTDTVNVTIKSDMNIIAVIPINRSVSNIASSTGLIGNFGEPINVEIDAAVNVHFTASYYQRKDGTMFNPLSDPSSPTDVANITTTLGASTNMLRVAAAGGLEYRTTAQILSDIGAAPLASPTFTGTVTLPTTIASVIKPASDSTTALQLTNAAGAAVLTVDTTNKRVGLNTTPSKPIDFVAREVLLGATSAGDAANSTVKNVYLSCRHHLTAEKPILGFFVTAAGSGSGGSNVSFGGGSSIYNCATSLSFYAAADAITVTGTEKMRIRTTGVAIGHATDATASADIAASTTAAASLRIRGGTAPTTPNAGDIWNDGTDFNLYGSGLKLHTGVIKPASNSTTALKLTKADGVTSVLTVDTTNSQLILNPTSVDAKGLIIGASAMPSGVSLYIENATPDFRQKIVRASGGLASNFTNVWVKNSTTNLETEAFAFGTLANVQNGATPPSISYIYMSSLASPAYNNANFFMLPSGYIGIGTGNNAPTARLDIAASTTAAASLRIRSGTAPSSPNAGDIWFDGTNLKMYDGTTTRTIFWT